MYFIVSSAAIGVTDESRQQFTVDVVMSEESKPEDSSPQPPASKPSPTPLSSSAPSCSSSSMTSPAQPLTDFMGMLKMKRSTEESHDTTGGGERVTNEEKSSEERVKNDRDETMETETASPEGESLTDMFKKG